MDNLRIEAMALGLSPEDWDYYQREHIGIFGHAPEPDFRTQVRCTHPMHGALQREMQAPGVSVPIPRDEVDPETVMTIDDPEIDPKFDQDEWADRSGKPWDVPREFDDGR